MSNWPGMQYCKCSKCKQVSVKTDYAVEPFFYCPYCDEVVAEEFDKMIERVHNAQRTIKLVEQAKIDAGKSKLKFP